MKPDQKAAVVEAPMTPAQKAKAVEVILSNAACGTCKHWKHACLDTGTCGTSKAPAYVYPESPACFRYEAAPPGTRWGLPP